MPAILPIARISLKNILLTTDFSPASIAAIPFALAFARIYEAKLFVAHVISPEPRLEITTDRVSPQDDEIWKQARRKLSEFVKPQGVDVSCESLVERGDLADVIPEIIRENEIDLVVLSTHGRRGIKKLVLGSAAEKIYRHAICPVLTIGPKVPVQPQPWTIRHILFPVDLESESAHGLPYALSLAEENQAELVLVHAAPLVPWQHQISVEEKLRADILCLIPPEAENWCKPDVVVRWNYPSEAILGVAAERKTDLIVMGVNPASTSHRPWPIASEVVGQAPCPVLTVRV
jgi:nucleotide-binding universal stress UspA family protein